MMDHERQGKELQEIFQTTQQTYRTFIESTLALQEQTLDFARSVLESVTEAQAEHSRATLDALAEQSRQGREGRAETDPGNDQRLYGGA